MSLLLIIPVLCFLTSFVHIFMKKLFGTLDFDSREERTLKQIIREQRAELAGIPMMKEYTSYVKLERKIVESEQKLQQIRSENQMKKTILKYGLSYGLNAIFTLALICISIYHRRTPIMVFPLDYKFMPFSGLMSFPTSVSNAVSVPFWIFASSFVMRSFAGYVK